MKREERKDPDDLIVIVMTGLMVLLLVATIVGFLFFDVK